MVATSALLSALLWAAVVVLALACNSARAAALSSGHATACSRVRPGVLNFSPEEVRASEDALHRYAQEQRKKKHGVVPSRGSAGSCDVDFRKQMHSCVQATPAWCWATGISQFLYFYKAIQESLPCVAVECRVVSEDLGGKCCPAGSNSTCDWHGAKNTAEIARVAGQMAAGHNFTAHGVPSEAKLQEILRSGRPIIGGWRWRGSSGGHAMTIGGCKSGDPVWGTQYWLHDPEAGSFSPMGYDNLVNHGELLWASTVY